MIHITKLILGNLEWIRLYRWAGKQVSWVALMAFMGMSLDCLSETGWRTESTGPAGFKYFIGIVGNPSVPDISWSDEELEQIKALGVNMVIGQEAHTQWMRETKNAPRKRTILTPGDSTLRR